MKNFVFLFICLLAGLVSAAQEKALYSSEKFEVYGNRVEQPPYKALALSATELHSDYQSPANAAYSPTFHFKFSLNSRDNEMISGTDHFVTVRPVNGEFASGMIKFGRQYVDTIGSVSTLPANTRWHVKLDLRDVMKAFETSGFYVLFNGQRIYKDDFKGVYIAGGAEPLTWDFENLNNNPSYELTDPGHDGIYEVTITLNPFKETAKSASWKLSADISAFASYHSDQMLADALYNLSLEEMLKDMRPDGAFMAGEKWDGVWTRDISYAIHLALAIINPEVAKVSLMRKVKNKRIIQDTGSGGSWPVSTDRTVWALAAWEVYKVTGDKNWLEQCFEIISNTWNDDRLTAFNSTTGLYFGESSFLDWREQTYPKWMEPVDIYGSQNLGTNAVHYEENQILAQMAKILGKPSAPYVSAAIQVKNGLNKLLWLPDKGYYAQYLYGKNYLISSPRSEALGEALCILFDIADKDHRTKVISSTPVTEFGIPCIFPQIPQIQPYHNDAIWPFVEAYWTLAAAKAGNEVAVEQGIAAVYRQSALFLTNKENFVASNGDFKGTAINSNRQIWSVAANLAMVYKLYFGMDFQPDGLYFHPFVPESFGGKKELTGFRYRNGVYQIKIQGSGNAIESFMLDGKKLSTPMLPAGMKGNHIVLIRLQSLLPKEQTLNMQKVDYTLPAPVIELSGDTLKFKEDVKTQKFTVYRNGGKLNETSASRFVLPKDDLYAEYMITTNDQQGYESFSDKPVIRHAAQREIRLEAEAFAAKSALAYKGFSGQGFVDLTKEKNVKFPFSVNIESAGTYVIFFGYSNGSGPVNTDNKCAIRSLLADGNVAGAVVMPQRGKDEWSNWGKSNYLQLKLQPGKHNFSLDLVLPQDQNMSGEVNTAMLDEIILVKAE